MPAGNVEHQAGMPLVEHQERSPAEHGARRELIGSLAGPPGTQLPTADVDGLPARVVKLDPLPLRDGRRRTSHGPVRSARGGGSCAAGCPRGGLCHSLGGRQDHGLR